MSGSKESSSPLKVHAGTGQFEPFYDSLLMCKALEQLPGMTAKNARDLTRRKDHILNLERNALLINYESALLYYRLDDTSAFLLVREYDAKVPPEFSPDGRFISYLKDNNIHVVDIETKVDHPLTKEGTPTTFVGRFDWVYQEELYGRDNFKGYW